MKLVVASAMADSDFNLGDPNPEENSICLNLSTRNSTIPHPNPNAELEPVKETAAQTNITNDSSLEFMSLEAIANSIPAKSKSTPRIPIGN